MSRFRDISIQRKLMVIIMLTTVVAVLLASGTFLAYDWKAFRNEIVRDLETLAEATKASTTNPLIYNDRESGGSIIRSLGVQPHIVAAWIFDREGKVFAEYRRGDAAGVKASPEPDLENGHRFSPEALVMARTIPFGDRTMGRLEIRTDLEQLEARRIQIFKIAGFVILGVLGVAFVVSALLARAVSKPILELVGAVRKVSDTKDYSVRAEKAGNDELGRLIDGMNGMLSQIELRDEELRVARDRAEQANRSKSAFLANMSHELRTPLTAIIGYSEILTDDAKELGMTDFLPDLDKIHAAGKHLLGLINSILDLSKVEAGKMELLPEKFDVLALVDDVTATSRPLMAKNGNTLEVDCEANLGKALNDVTKTRQVLLNLLSNAAKFTDHGKVRLDVRRQPGEGTDWLVVTVTDTGIGMTEEQLKKLFQPFTQADASTARNYGGTGLGLALSQRFVEMMLGKIRVKSIYGEGTTFTLKLPMNVVGAKQFEGSHRLLDSRELSREEIDRIKQATGTKPLVLVVDDEVSVQGLLRELLVKEGFRVAVAGGGEEGLRLARELRPEIITLDVRMPDLDGWTVLTRLKSDPKTAEIPVIVISVVDEEQKGYTLGADYLTKPIDRGRLQAILARHRGTGEAPLGLVVDDDPNIRNVLCRLLRDESWNVEEAEDGIAALRRVSQGEPDLILLDLMMPRMDGFDFVTQLRKNDAWRKIPIVVLTAMDLGPEERQRLNGGVDKVLAKGAFSLEDLKTEVRALAQGARRGTTS